MFLVTRAVWPHLVARDLIARGTASIVNIASITATRGAYFMPQNAHGAAKGGVLALTYQLVTEGGPHGIRVNAVSPAMTATPQTAPLLADTDGPFAGELARIPLGRVGQPGGRGPRGAVPGLRRGRARQRGQHPGGRGCGGRWLTL